MVSDDRSMKKLADALHSLRVALDMINTYRVENAKLVASLVVVGKMARTGSSLKDIARFSDQALILLGKKKP